MKLIKANIVKHTRKPYTEEVKEFERQMKEEREASLNTSPKEEIDIFDFSKKKRAYYNLEILYNETHVKVSLIEIDTENTVLSKTTKVKWKDRAVDFVIGGLGKSNYKILTPILVDYELQVKPQRPKVEKYNYKPLKIDFIDWYKEKLQSLITIIDNNGYGYIIKNLDYRIEYMSKKLIIDIPVTQFGIVERGLHRFVFSYQENTYLYFFNKQLKKKCSSIIEIFENE